MLSNKLNYIGFSFIPTATCFYTNGKTFQLFAPLRSCYNFLLHSRRTNVDLSDPLLSLYHKIFVKLLTQRYSGILFLEVVHYMKSFLSRGSLLEGQRVARIVRTKAQDFRNNGNLFIVAVRSTLHNKIQSYRLRFDRKFFHKTPRHKLHVFEICEKRCTFQGSFTNETNIRIGKVSTLYTSSSSSLF